MSGARIAVVGCGHVGVVTAAFFAERGNAVTGIDIDAARIDALSRGDVPFSEPGLGELARRNIKQGRLRFTASYEQAMDRAEFVFVCVNTPSTATGAADMRYVRGAVEQIADCLGDAEGTPVLVNKSTSPIGTGETIETMLARRLPERLRPAIVANPEFLREGRAVEDVFHPDRIVVGAERASDAQRVAALYDGIDAPVIVTDLRTAEMIKYVSNAFLATKVSFINEIARLTECLGVDVDTLRHGVALDPRIGGDFFTPGIGYGGSCLPKDVAALCHTGDSVGVAMRLLAAVQETNIGQRKHAVNTIRRALGTIDGARIAAWGATFKGGTEDLRASPAVDVIQLLRNEGARVALFDPSVGDDAAGFVDFVCESPIAAAEGADAVALLSDWPCFLDVDLSNLRAAMRGNAIYDGRNMLRREDAEAAGLIYYGVGRPPSFDAPPAGARARVA